MFACKKCNTKLETGWKLCPKCGAPAEYTDEPRQPESSLDKTVKRTSDLYGAVRLDNLPEGYVIDDRYEIKRKLGQGGFGAVYLAFDWKMHSDKALKVIPDEVANDRESMEQLRHEARVMLRLNHPNIVRVYDFHDDGRIKYIDMEYVEGKTLTDVKLDRPEKKIPEDEVIRYAIQIAEALEYAHNENILHKDIKPQNIMVMRNGNVKVMDFGIAEVVRSSMTRLQHASSSGTLVNMSPEQIRGKEVGKESDMYSFGAMLYDLLSGHPPFYKGDIHYQILNEQPEKINGISDWLNIFIQTCLEKHYRDRPDSFGKLIKLLNADSADSGLISETDSSDRKNIREIFDHRRKMRLSPRAIVAAIILLAVFISIIWYSVEESKRRDDIARVEAEQRMEEERRAEEVHRIEEESSAEEARQAEEARLAEEARSEEAVRRSEEERRAEEAKRVEEVRRAEEERRAEELRWAEDERQAEEVLRAKKARRAEEEFREEVKDIDGNIYRIVKIGEKWWMTENLRVTRYQNGTPILNITDNTEWNSEREGAWANYINNALYDEIYGKLYNWYAVNDSRGICPEGWRVPNDADWQTLIAYLGGDRRAANKMKSTQGWSAPTTGVNNESGFSGLPGGYRHDDGLFLPVGGYGYWWSSTEFNANSSLLFSLYYNSNSVNRLSKDKRFGLSIRCIRD